MVKSLNKMTGMMSYFKVFAQKLICVIVLVAFTGCAAMFHGVSQQVHIRSNYSDVKLYLNGDFTGTGSTVTTFKKKKKYVITARKEGCEEVSTVPTKSFDMVTLLGILIDYGVISVLLIDGAFTGAWKQFDQTSFVIDPICA